MTGVNEKQKPPVRGRARSVRDADFQIIKEARAPFNFTTLPGKNRETGTAREANPFLSGAGLQSSESTHGYLPRDLAEKTLNAELERYKAQVQALAVELAKVEERELQRIAADLHDQIGQMLFAAKSKLERLMMKDMPSALTRPVNEVIELVNRALLDTKELIVEISPPDLYVFGLETAIRTLLEKIEMDYGIKRAFRQIGRPLPLSEELNGVLFRAARELIINVVKHARAENIRVSIQYHGDRIRITIEDDGRGFHLHDDTPDSKPRDGYGLFSLKERLGFMGGQLEIITTRDKGTKAAIVLPCRSGYTGPRGE